MEKEHDINEEYEKLFGKAAKINLFNSDEEYDNLRQEILSQPHELNFQSKLPFQDIKLLPYKEYIWDKVQKEAKSKGFRVFYIKLRSPYCRAAGYYDPKKESFCLLKYSYIVSKDRFPIEEKALQEGRNELLLPLCIEEGRKKYTSEDIIFSSPLDTASYVLGIKTSLMAWKDYKGKNIFNYFPKLSTDETAKQRRIKEKKKEEELRYTLIANVVGNIQKYLEEREHKHLFVIKKKNVCKAEGYFDPKTGFFFILRNSLVARQSDRTYSSSPSGSARQLFLEKACRIKGDYFLVTKDAKCRSAAAAACYVLGTNAEYTEWKDYSNQSLSDVYPDIAFENDPLKRKSEEKNKIDKSKHVFYIEEIIAGKKVCSASGLYNEETNKFLIKKGSILSYEVSSAYRYTASEIQRQKFIIANCIIKSYGFMLKNDTICNSPNTAASFVVGREVDGWEIWKDEKKCSLKKIFKEI